MRCASDLGVQGVSKLQRFDQVFVPEITACVDLSNGSMSESVSRERCRRRLLASQFFERRRDRCEHAAEVLIQAVDEAKWSGWDGVCRKDVLRWTRSLFYATVSMG